MRGFFDRPECVTLITQNSVPSCMRDCLLAGTAQVRPEARQNIGSAISQLRSPGPQEPRALREPQHIHSCPLRAPASGKVSSTFTGTHLNAAALCAQGAPFGLRLLADGRTVTVLSRVSAVQKQRSGAEEISGNKFYGRAQQPLHPKITRSAPPTLSTPGRSSHW